MRGNQFGNVFCVTTFGESHGPGLGAVIDGCPAGVKWQGDMLQRFLYRRQPGQNAFTSARKEGDQVQIFSGVYQERTLGTPIAGVILNQDARSADYDPEKMKMRQGHATDLWQQKFGHSDPRGSGRASGRETASRVLAGAVAKMFVEQAHPPVRVMVFTDRIGPLALTALELREAFDSLRVAPWDVDKMSLRCPQSERNAAMEALLSKAQAQGESYGGSVTVQVEGLPPGLGEPVFGKLKNCLAASYLSIGATSAVQMGDGLEAASQAGENFHRLDQDYGGQRGGLSTGDPLRAQVFFKPTSSRKDVAKQGRHDPCIVPRAVPVVEAMTWLVLADLFLLSRLNRL